MKVFDLRCGHGHGFEGWFASEEDFQSQLARGLLSCPLCGDATVEKLPSAPRLNLGAGSQPEASAPQEAMPTPEQLWLRAVRHVLEHTEDVGERFAEEARRIHYGEVPSRGIRGQTTQEDAQALREEGIEVLTLPLPVGMKGPLQ
ncbi:MULTISPECIES: DUF1178 family protein [Caldimonas]|jgi:hypothetical protein|uniref:DUF1178 family protein n=1 Tax=Caldimonas TaxID=196013 RepID=UPI0003827799|nr:MULTISPECIES: DUF1178 family protein [Caldimonas]GIX23810.1 MAG: hypothetical protein KatS3mg122_1041 [Caldimonas sp.]